VVYERIPSPPALPEGWSARFARPNEEEAVLRVFEQAFPRWPKLEGSVSPLEHLRWKMSCHPLAEKFHIVVDTPDGIVGARLEWAFDTKLNDRVVLMRESVDRGVMPEHQLKYAMSAMRVFGQQLRDASFDMYLGYQGGAPGMEKLRKYRVPESTRYHRRMDILVCDPALAPPRPASETSWQLCEVKSFDERADALWSKASQQFQFGVIRSSAYLNWRYADARAGGYVVLAAEENGRWLGYIVRRSSGELGYIADLLALPERSDVVDSLLSAAIERFRREGRREIECWSEAHSVYRWSLDNAGFRKPRRSIGLTFRPLSFPAAEAAFLDDPTASILFSAGDTDLV